MDIRTIEYVWENDEKTILTDDVVVGDGTITYDENFDYDERIFFYFHDSKEYKKAFQNNGIGCGFTVLREVSSD